MQAMTVAIGPAGIAYFAQQMVANQLTTLLGQVEPPDRKIPIGSFRSAGFGWSDFYSAVNVSLSQGRMKDFAPAFQGIQQQTTAGQFALTMLASHFKAHYAWHEKYDEYSCMQDNCSSHSGLTGDYSYQPGFGSLTLTVTLGFVWNASTKSYDINVVGSANASIDHPSPNIPGQSILQAEETSCFSSHVSDATAASVGSIDFGGLTASIFPPLLHSIPASGSLPNKITYDFGIGDSGLTFPGNAGIAVGVTGTVTYDGTAYPGTAPPALPVPPPPAASDTHHLQLYVSGYELDALHWAFFKAGLLAVTVEPGDLQDSDVLKCKTYAAIPGFKPYGAFGMNAKIVPKVAPTIAFQQVWELTKAVEAVLQGQLPADVYALINGAGMQGNAYVDKTAFESDMTDVGIASRYWQTIEKAAAAMGMVLTQDIEFTLTIENGATPQPNLVFEIQRIDILTTLKLGTTGGAQTLLFDFTHVSYTAKFESTTIPKFVSKDFGDFIWPTAGEPRYEAALALIGKTGAPLPIMSGFKFVFEQAQLSIQQGYVSILAQVAREA